MLGDEGIEQRDQTIVQIGEAVADKQTSTDAPT